MIYFLIPKMHIKLYEYLECCPNTSSIIIPKLSYTLSRYLFEIKEQIRDHIYEWDLFKKYTNTYEYIHSSVPAKKKSVAKYKPLSRSYFKMIELIEILHLEPNEKAIRSFHLAEGPGGFIEAISHIRNCKEDKYIGMTLLDDKNDDMIPAWKKSFHFLDLNRNVYIETGADKTGNLLSIKNFKYCKEKYGSSIHFITADGGFDFSADFNGQEQNMTRLLFAQVCYALCMQCKDGCFVLKIFDCFTEATLDILALLSSFYKKVYITKPNTSRSANSEKYVVCKGFLYSNNTHFYPFIYKTFEQMLVLNNDILIKRLLPKYSIPYYFVFKIEEYNSIFGQQQIENIHYTLSLMGSKPKQEKIENIIKSNVQKCINWCMKHNIPYNIIFRDIHIDS